MGSGPTGLTGWYQLLQGGDARHGLSWFVPRGSARLLVCCHADRGVVSENGIGFVLLFFVFWQNGFSSFSRFARKSCAGLGGSLRLCDLYGFRIFDFVESF
jgi:hypothetical protein